MSPAVRHTPRHTPLLTIRILIAVEEVEAIVDSGASAPVIGSRIATKLVVLRRAKKVKVRQHDGSHLSRGKYVVNTSFSVFCMGNFLGKFLLDVEVLDIGKRDIVLGLSWLKENRFVVDPIDKCLRNVDKGLVLPCSVQWIPSVSLLDLDKEPLEDGEILLIIDTSEWCSYYAQVFSTEQADRLPKHKAWDHEILLQDPNIKIPTGAIYKTT